MGFDTDYTDPRRMSAAIARRVSRAMGSFCPRYLPDTGLCPDIPNAMRNVWLDAALANRRNVSCARRLSRRDPISRLAGKTDFWLFDFATLPLCSATIDKRIVATKQMRMCYGLLPIQNGGGSPPLGGAESHHPLSKPA